MIPIPEPLVSLLAWQSLWKQGLRPTGKRRKCSSAESPAHFRHAGALLEAYPGDHGSHWHTEALGFAATLANEAQRSAKTFQHC